MRKKSESRLLRDWSDNDCLVAPFIDPKTEMEFRRWVAERYGEIDALLGFSSDRFAIIPNRTVPTRLWFALRSDYLKAYKIAESEHKSIVEFARNLK